MTKIINGEIDCSTGGNTRRISLRVFSFRLHNKASCKGDSMEEGKECKNTTGKQPQKPKISRGKGFSV